MGQLMQPLGSWLQTHLHQRIKAIESQYDTPSLAICKGKNECIKGKHIGRQQCTEHATRTTSYKNLQEDARPVDASWMMPDVGGLLQPQTHPHQTASSITEPSRNM